MLSIKKGTYENLNFLEKLEKSSFDPKLQMSRDLISNILLDKTQEIYIAKLDDVKVGAIIIKNKNEILRIDSIAVIPKYRRKDIGRKLIKYVINMLKNKEVKIIVLEVDSSKEKLVLWYKGFGFLIIGKLKNYYGLGKDAYEMALMIRK